jgi:hypothetical protein
MAVFLSTAPTLLDKVTRRAHRHHRVAGERRWRLLGGEWVRFPQRRGRLRIFLLVLRARLPVYLLDLITERVNAGLKAANSVA